MAKANVDIGVLDETMIELPEVREGGMSGRNEQRKLGTTHGSPRRSRTGKASLGQPAFQPYWGKPAVRNDRGDRGNVGIIRSPVRASILPDFHYRTSGLLSV